jgi:transcriptional regulator with XRE-family HTH domain
MVGIGGEYMFGEQLIQFRAKHNLTQTQLAEMLGLSVGMIHKYEQKGSVPTAKNMILINNKMKEYEVTQNGQN